MIKYNWAREELRWFLMGRKYGLLVRQTDTSATFLPDLQKKKKNKKKLQQQQQLITSPKPSAGLSLPHLTIKAQTTSNQIKGWYSLFAR